MIKANIFKSALLAVAVSLCGSIQAYAATSFAGSSTGVFGQPTAGAGAIFSGVGTNTFTTGEAFTSSDTPNILTFTGNLFSSITDSPFVIGNLDYTNGVTFVGSNVDSAQLKTTLNLTSPLAISQAFDFDLDFDLTPNLGNDPTADADRLIALTSVPNQTFNFDNKTFTLELLGFTQDGGTSINNTFFAFEDTTTSGALVGRITEAINPQDVPEPISLLAIGAFGVLAATTVRKRDERKA